jgi:hypothetical protein
MYFNQFFFVKCYYNFELQNIYDLNFYIEKNYYICLIGIEKSPVIIAGFFFHLIKLKNWR